jgi:hypothetical protein
MARMVTIGDQRRRVTLFGMGSAEMLLGALFVVYWQIR